VLIWHDKSKGTTTMAKMIAFDEEAPAIADQFSRTFGVFREAEAGSDVSFDAIVAPDTPDGQTLTALYGVIFLPATYRASE
jgi:hypothetical protein